MSCAARCLPALFSESVSCGVPLSDSRSDLALPPSLVLSFPLSIPHSTDGRIGAGGCKSGSVVPLTFSHTLLCPSSTSRVATVLFSFLFSLSPRGKQGACVLQVYKAGGGACSGYPREGIPRRKNKGVGGKEKPLGSIWFSEPRTAADYLSANCTTEAPH